MACYAALLSLFHTLNHIKNHPRPPVSLDQKQLHSLTQNLTLLLDFLERYPTYEDDYLESRIAAAAYAVEDVIETHIVDQIDRAGLKNDHVEHISSVDLYGSLERVIDDMDLIKKEVMEIIQDKTMTMRARDHDLHTNSSLSTASTWQSSITPVFDDAVINEVLDELTGQQSSFKIIPVVGMGGIGKTTFARSIYTSPLIVEHFDIRAWVTISQEYSRAHILQVLCLEVKGSINGMSEMSEDEIGLILYKHLWGRRYLIVLDDIWSVDAWYEIKSFFPDNNASRIMITTRLSNLALDLSGSHVVQMQFLNEDKSWDLLCKTVFGTLDCPTELENTGKEIARKCRGLPLSIAVIGGLLKKSNMTRVYWTYTLENLSSLINLENDEYTLRILSTSYTELPMHLKPCFLYLGIFPEDLVIKASLLIKLWVAEGILRPIDDTSLEEVANEYLKEIIDRNLVLVSKLRWNGEARFCKIHDLLRDVCLREAQKHKLFCIVSWQQRHHTLQGINMERRICINHEIAKEEYSPEFLHAVESASLTRSLLYRMRVNRKDNSLSLRFRLLRVYSSVDGRDSYVDDSGNSIFEHANIRHLSLRLIFRDVAPRLIFLCSRVWHLQTLKVEVEGQYFRKPIMAPSAIWEMPLLRHVTLDRFALPDPPNGEGSFVLQNLRTLSGITNFKFSEDVAKRMPNIKKLKLIYDKFGLDEDGGLPDFCLDNIGRLQKLESLNLEVTKCDEFGLENIMRNFVSFPHSLKKLSLKGTRLSWEDFNIRIGALPLLQVLKLSLNACVGPRWETNEGQFCSLRYLNIWYFEDLQYWETDNAHFPCLEHLFLGFLWFLEEIPSSVGDIPTLKSIESHYCCKSVEDSARRIKEEQEENGNEDLQLIIGSFADEQREEDSIEVHSEEEVDEEDEVDSNKEEDGVGSNKEEDQVTPSSKFARICCCSWNWCCC